MWKRDQTVPTAKAHRDPPADAPQAVTAPAEKVVMNLGKSVVIRGELSGSEDFTLYGQMEGSIRLPDHTLTVGPGADIKAEISARIVVIMGAVTGNVTATEKVEIQATGLVTGDIVSPRLAVADEGRLNGRIEMPRSGATDARVP